MMDTSNETESLKMTFMNKFRAIVYGINLSNIKNMMVNDFEDLNNDANVSILKDTLNITACLKSMMIDLRLLVMNANEADDIDKVSWATLYEQNILEDIFIILYYFIKKGSRHAATAEEKLYSLQAAEICIMLHLLPCENELYFHSKVPQACFAALKLKFLRAPEDDDLVQCYLNDILCFIDNNVTDFHFNFATLNYITSLLVSLTEKNAASVITEFDNLTGPHIRYQAYKCLNSLSYMVFENADLISVFLQAFAAHILSYENDVDEQLDGQSHQQIQNIRETCINFLIYLQNRYPNKFDNFLHFSYKLCLESLPSFNSVLIIYIENVISNINTDNYAQFMNWFKRILSHFDPKVRIIMHRVLFTLLANKPPEQSDDVSVGCISVLFDRMAEACLDVDEGVQNIALQNMEKLLNAARFNTNVLLRKPVLDQFSYPSEFGKKMLQILEILIYNDRKRTVFLKLLINILYNILMIHRKWIVGKTINMFVTLYDNANNRSLEKFMLTLANNIYRKNQKHSATLALFVSIFVPEILEKREQRHTAYTSRVFAELIFDGIINPDLKDFAWQLIQMIVKQTFQLDEIIYCLNRQHPVVLNIAKCVLDELNNYEPALRLLGSIAEHVPDFKDKLGESVACKIISFITFRNVTNIPATKFAAIERLIRYLSEQNCLLLESILYDALDKSEIAVDNIPAAVSLLATLSSFRIYNPSISSNKNTLAGLQKVLERRVFNKMSRLVNKYNTEEFELLLRDLLTLGHTGMRSNIQADVSTCGLLALFITPGHHGGLSDFFEIYPKAWAMCIQSYGRLCVRDYEKMSTCIQVMRKCIKSNIPDVQIQALFILHDNCVLNNTSCIQLRNDLFFLLCNENAQVRLAALEMIIKLQRKANIKFESFQHLQFILCLCDEDKSIANLIENFIDENYCEQHHKFIIDDLIKIVVLNNTSEMTPVYIVDTVHLRLSTLSISNKKFIYYILCCQFSLEHKVTLIGYVVRMFIDAYCDRLFEQYSEPEEIVKEALIILLCALPHYAIQNLSGTYHQTINLILIRKKMFLNENKTYLHNQKKKRKPHKENAFLTKKTNKIQAIISHLITSLMKFWEIINKNNIKLIYGVICILIHTISTYGDEVVQLLLDNEDVQQFLEMVQMYIQSVDFETLIVDDGNSVIKLEDIYNWSDKDERVRNQKINTLKRNLNNSCIKYL